MATYFFIKEPKQVLNLQEYKKTVSTLRIPKHLKNTLKDGIQRHGSLARYLSHLIKKYRLFFYIEGIPFSEKIKTEYQERGIPCFTKTFRPELKDWLELGMWACALNFSRCKLFAILLTFEDENDPIVNHRTFLYAAYVVTTPYNLRIPRLVKILRKGRNILERGITFYNPP